MNASFNQYATYGYGYPGSRGLTWPEGQASTSNPDSESQAFPIYWETDYQPSVDEITNTKVSPHE